MKNAYINGYLSGYMSKVSALLPSSVKIIQDAMATAAKQNEVFEAAAKDKAIKDAAFKIFPTSGGASAEVASDVASAATKGNFPWQPVAVGGGALAIGGGAVMGGNAIGNAKAEELKKALEATEAANAARITKLTDEQKAAMQRMEYGKGQENLKMNALEDRARLEQLGLLGAAGAAGGAGIGATIGKPGKKLEKAVIGGAIGAAGLPLAALLAEKISNKKLLGV